MPSRTQQHIDRALTNMSVAYMQTEDMFIADKVFPIIPVQKQSDLYFIYDRADFFRDSAQVRAQGTESAGGTYNIHQSEPYYCRKHAFHYDITEEERVNADSPLQPNQDATEFVTHKMLIRRENDWAAKYFHEGVWGTEIKGVDGASGGPTEATKFNKATSDPIQVITNQIVAIGEKTGFKPNTIVMSPYVFYALKNHEDVLDRIKYTQKGIVTQDLLAQLFEVDRVFVPWGVLNEADMGDDEKNKFIMGKHLLLCYVNPRPAIKKPSAGYIFAWKGLKGAGAYGNRIVRFPVPWLGMDTERIEGEIAFDSKVVGKDLGVFFKDIVD